MTLPLAVFGITNDTLNMVVQLLLLVLVVVWLALIVYTYLDARRRIADPILVGCATAASLFPFVGTVVYMIVRPPEFLADAAERELEMQAAEARMHDARFTPCPHCDYPVGRDYLRCPSCLRKLRDACSTCDRPLDPDWRICPYCEAEIAGVTPPPRRRRTGTTGESDAVTPAPTTTSGTRRRRASRSAAPAATAVEESSGDETAATSAPAPAPAARRRTGTTADNPAAEGAPRRRRTPATQNTEALKAEEAMAPRRSRARGTAPTDTPPAGE